MDHYKAKGAFHRNKLESGVLGNSVVVQWLELGAFTAEGPGSTPGRRTTKILQASGGSGQKTETKTKESGVLLLQSVSFK